MVLQSEDFRKFPFFDAFLKPHGQGTGDRELISSKPPQLGTGDGRIERNGTVLVNKSVPKYSRIPHNPYPSVDGPGYGL